MKTSSLPPLPDNAPHILVVDDDRRLRDLLSRFLEENGYLVSTAANTAEADREVEMFIFDLIVLDAMMPQETGFAFLKRVRPALQTPVLMLTARTDVTDRIQGLELGADDYLAKPFEPKELLLRMGNILKRFSKLDAHAAFTPDAVRFGPFIYRIDREELRRGEDVIRLTERERSMLTVLARQAGRQVPREALAAPGEGAVGERTIDVQVNRLRRKIEADPSQPIFLQAVRGVGYRLLAE